jgi:hypothetical protein
MYTKSDAVAGSRPAVVPAEAGKVIVADASVEVTAAQIALSALVGLVVLPAGTVPLDFVLIVDDLDTGTALVQDVGVLNALETDLVASTNVLTGSTIGQAGGYARATALPDALVAPNAADRVIAVKTTTGGILAVKATGTVTSTGVDVTADDTVTVNGKAYKFVAAPADEGDVDIGGTAAITLDNLKLAINRTDPDTNDGVKYKCAAAHPTVAATTNTDTVQTLEALTTGAGGNALTLAKSAVTLSVSHDHLEGGVTAVPLQAGTIRGILTYRAEEYGG